MPWHVTWRAFSVGRSYYVESMALLIVSGPSNAGPGEREQMLDASRQHFEKLGVTRDQIVRIDVPGRGGGEVGEGSVRAELEPMIPLLQSGSLFGEPEGLELIDAQNLQKAEVESLVELLESADLGNTHVVVLSAGAVHKSVSAIAKDRGTTVSVKKMWERQASQWLDAELKERNIKLEAAAKETLLHRFGTDTASLGQALDQLEEIQEKVTADMILARFKNRPDEPTWHITDAIAKGDTGTALRRLSDFLVHGHPLVYLAALEGDLKRRSLASAAPDRETLKEWLGGRSNDRQLSRLWSQRGRVRESSLRRAQEALVRADRVIKTQPEDVHRVTLERLTVAFCRWYG